MMLRVDLGWIGGLVVDATLCLLEKVYSRALVDGIGKVAQSQDCTKQYGLVDDGILLFVGAWGHCAPLNVTGWWVRMRRGIADSLVWVASYMYRTGLKGAE